MATSLITAFNGLRANVELSGLQQTTVSDRQARVRQILERDLAVTTSFLTGSYVRQTLIGPLSKADVDILVVLDNEYASRGARNVLNMVQRVLAKSYPSSKVSLNGQAVTITFTDFQVDVVPAFDQGWLFSGHRYKICDSGSNNWIETDPRKHTQISSDANKGHSGLLVPCIKQLKAWNRTVNRPLRSFHLEVLAWDIFGRSGWPFGHWMGRDWENVRHFFDEARSRISQMQHDPAGSGKDVGAYLAGQALADAISKAKMAYERCARAEEAAKAGRLSDAHDAFRKVFGTYYPYTT